MCLMNRSLPPQLEFVFSNIDQYEYLTIDFTYRLESI